MPAPLVRATEGRTFLLLVALAAASSFAVQGWVWPLAAGRDWQDYLVYWHELREPDALFPALMVTRTPLAPLAFGPLMELGGAPLAEAGAGVLYAAAVVLWVAAARRFGRVAALLVAALLVVAPTYGLFFRQIGSDPVFALVLAAVTLLALRAAGRPAAGRFAVLGAAVAALVLARPSGQPFLLLALLPLGLRLPLASRARHGAAFVAAAGVCLGTYAVVNAVRYDDLTIARGSGGGIPLYRAFVVDRIVEPGNGSASRELAAALAADLARREPYRSWGFDARELMAAGATWAMDDLPPLADRVWGWDEGQAKLLAVGLEAVRARPGAYLDGVAASLDELFLARYTGPPGTGWVGDVEPPAVPTDAVLGPPGRGRRLPGEAHALGSVYAIALLNNWALSPSPRYEVTGGVLPVDGPVWSPLEKRGLRWRDPEDGRRYDRLRALVLDYQRELAVGLRHAHGEAQLRALMHLTPGVGWWLLAAVLVGAVRRPRGLWPLVAVTACGVAVLVATAAGFPGDRNYAAPFLPLAIVLAVAVAVRSLPLSGGRGRRAPAAS